jgi:hypothetical protein
LCAANIDTTTPPLCTTGCGFYASADGFCSSCAKRGASSLPRKTPEQLEADERASADAAAAEFFFARSEADVARTAECLRNAHRTADMIATPRDLWEVLGGAWVPVFLNAAEAEPLFALYEKRSDGWLYGHVIACRVVDNWNLRGCCDNTLGYHRGDNVKGAREMTLPSRIEWTKGQLALASRM